MFEIYKSYGWIQQDHWKPAPLALLDMGVEKRRETSYYFDNRQRGSYHGFLFQYTIEGEGIWESADGRCVLPKDCAFITPIPDDSRYYAAQTSDAGWSFFYLHFGGYVAGQIVAEIREKYGSVLSFSETPVFAATFAAEHEAVCLGKQYRQYEGSAFLYRFLTELLAELEAGQTVLASVVEKGYDWLSQNFTSSFSLSELCDRLCVSLPHFSRQFHAAYGVTPHRFVTKLRLEHAMSLLLNTSLSIRDVAVQSGFAEANYFSKVFRKYTGMAPGDFRSRH